MVNSERVDLLVGSVVAERYRLDRVLGEGGMGVVYAATHTTLHKSVALKVIRASLAGDAAARYRMVREARAACAIRHPNIIDVHDIVELCDGTPVIVMDLLEGESLATKLQREQTIALAEVARILVPVALALSAAHEVGIVHRDIKPANIFLEANRDGGSGVRVLDFGLAKLARRDGHAEGSAQLTESGVVVGTPGYMSPEQLFGESDIDPRADVWSFGVVLYECLAGVRPISADNVGQAFFKILTGEGIPKITAYAPHLPPPLVATIARMLSHDRAARPETLREVAAVLEQSIRTPAAELVLANAAPSRCDDRLYRPNRRVRLDPAICSEVRKRHAARREALPSGLSVTTLERVERGEPVYIETARRYAALVEVPVQRLLLRTEAKDGGEDTGPPTVAVLPFNVLDAGEDGRYFSDGLVEDLLTRLGKRWFPVISRGSSFHYRGERPDAQRIRAELDADYVIEGSVRRSGGRLRVTARVTHTPTSRQVWADSFDCTYERVFEQQDGLVATIVSQADVAIRETEHRALLQRNPTDLAAWELSLRGSWHFHRRTKEDIAEAQSFLQQALKRDPMLPLAWYFLALTHQRVMLHRWSSNLLDSLRDMKAVCNDFARHHPNDAGLHIAEAYVSVYSGDRRSAMLRLREAIDLDPNSPAAYSLYGQTLAMGNDVDEAIEQFEQAIRLSPRDSELWSMRIGLALSHFIAERYQDMLHWAELAVQSKPSVSFPHSAVAIAKSNLGDTDGATAAVRALLDVEPEASVGKLAPLLGSLHPDIAALYLEGLRRAGVPA